MTIETKFEPGDTVWMMHQNKPQEFAVKRLFVRTDPDGLYQTHKVEITYEINISGGQSVWEHSLFATKAELLASL